MLSGKESQNMFQLKKDPYVLDINHVDENMFNYESKGDQMVFFPYHNSF